MTDKPMVFKAGSPEYESAKKRMDAHKKRKVRSNYGGSIPPEVCYE